MTGEEAKEFIVRSVKDGVDIAKVADAIKALEQEPRWIPVSEELPKVADCYSVTREIGDDLIVSACYFDGINNWHDDNWINYERNYLTDVVAWMPALQPYKAKSEDEVEK